MIAFVQYNLFLSHSPSNRTMSSANDIARMLNVRGVDSTALAEVMLDYFDDDRGMFTFFSNHK